MSSPCELNSSQLRRPSYFQGPDGKAAMSSIQSRITRKGETISQPVMEALLAQKQQGKLSNSALEHWVNKFEDEYEVYYKDSSEEKQEDLSDIESQFEALHKEVEDEYATKKFNSCVPQHTLLDSSFAKGKVKLNHKKSFSSKVKLPKEPMDQSYEISRTQEEPPRIMNLNKRNPFEEESSPYGSPRSGIRMQSSNIARDIKHPKHNTEDMFKLGTEPTVTTVKQTKKTAERKQKHQDFIPIAHLTEEEMNKIIESQKKKDRNDNSNQSSEQNDYEDVKVFKKRTKKNKKDIPVNEIEDTSKHSFNNRELKKKDSTFVFDRIEQKLNVEHPKKQFRNDLSEIKENKMHSSKEEDMIENKVALDEAEQKQKVKGPKKPFESFQNCLFTTFTACVPWCMMKQVYWKKDRKSEELFTITARRNSRSRIKMKFREQNGSY